MNFKKRTYRLPADVIVQFEKLVKTENRNEVVAGLIKDWLAEQERLALREQIIEGCREMADLYLAIEREFHPLEEEVQRRF